MANETDPILRVKSEVFQRFTNTSNGGTYNCRKIRNSTNWSQHAWGNALDIMVPDLPTGDRVVAWLVANRGRHGTGTILWRVADHFDHVHVEGLPKQKGTPPCGGGTPRQGDPSPGGGADLPPDFWSDVRERNEAAEGDNPFIPNSIENVGKAVELLFTGETWIRVGLFIGGAALLAGGLTMIGKEMASPLIKDIADIAGSIPGAGKLATAVVR